MISGSPIPFLSGFLLAPLMLGVINRTKAIFAGRTGQPLLQPYFDLWRLLHKGAVYSETTTWIFRAAPVVVLSATLAALALTPLGGVPALVCFPGDVFLFALLLGVVRFMLILGALDTGSAFEGMGASREAAFSALTEPVLILGLASLAEQARRFSLTGLYASLDVATWWQAGPGFALVVIVMLVVFLVENARIPVDDPNTHLELTMIHEVMVLDYSGPDFGFIQYSAALKHWMLGCLIVGVAVPVRTGSWAMDTAAGIGGLAALAVVIGGVESFMARWRLLRVPHLVVGAAVLAAIALMVAVG